MRASQVGTRKRAETPERRIEKKNARYREVVKPVVVDKDFDWCAWNDAKKQTLTYVRKKAKETGESKGLTNKKIEAVRAQDPQDGHVALFSHTLNGAKVWDGVVIKKRNKRPVIEFPIR